MYQQVSNIKNLDLKKYCWIGTGGLASNVFIAESELHLSNYLKNKNKKNFFVLGSGSNILFRDKGFSGKLIKLSSKFRGINYSSDKKYLVCGAASLKKELSYFALKNNITGFEFLSCIPGNLAGGVIMNAGCFEHLAERLQRVAQGKPIQTRIVEWSSILPRGEQRQSAGAWR